MVAVTRWVEYSPSAAGEADVVISSGADPLIEFTNDFSENHINLADVKIEVQTTGAGGIAINGLTLEENETKTVYFGRISLSFRRRSSCRACKRLYSNGYCGKEKKDGRI